MFIAKDSANTRQPITTSPQVTPGRNGGFMVVVGTGKFIEPGDTSTAGTQSVYGIFDPISNTASDYQIGRSKLYQRTVVDGTTTVISGSDTFTLGTGTGTYRGWFFDLSQTRERIAVESAQGTGFVALNSTIPDGQCSGDGTGRSFCLNPDYGNSACSINLTQAGLLSRPNVITISTDTEAFTQRSNTGKRYAKLSQSLVTTGTKITDAGNVASSTSNVNAKSTSGSGSGLPPSPEGRVSWREIRSFRDN
jgi:type IV pilus assembly protein PilY1